MKIVIPVINENGLDSQLSEHFGRAPYFTVIKLDEKYNIMTQKTESNSGEHLTGDGHHSSCNHPYRILMFNPDALITYGLGPRALNIFKKANVVVMKAKSSTVREVLYEYSNNQLEELTEGCQNSQH
ncbi:MAG: NifB/NifX family molybdenum-iron cluster-binding protein [Candidatus Bathyarchaeota archaeon]